MDIGHEFVVGFSSNHVPAVAAHDLATGRLREVLVEGGWISPTYGVKRPAPVVVLRVRARDADVVTRIEAAP